MHGVARDPIGSRPCLAPSQVRANVVAACRLACEFMASGRVCLSWAEASNNLGSPRRVVPRLRCRHAPAVHGLPRAQLPLAGSRRVGVPRVLDGRRCVSCDVGSPVRFHGTPRKFARSAHLDWTTRALEPAALIIRLGSVSGIPEESDFRGRCGAGMSYRGSSRRAMLTGPIFSQIQARRPHLATVCAARPSSGVHGAHTVQKVHVVELGCAPLSKARTQARRGRCASSAGLRELLGRVEELFGKFCKGSNFGQLRSKPLTLSRIRAEFGRIRV